MKIQQYLFKIKTAGLEQIVLILIQNEGLKQKLMHVLPENEEIKKNCNFKQNSGK